MSKKRSPIIKHASVNHVSVLIWVLIFVAIGSLVLLYSQAAGEPVAFEAENGSLASGAVKLLDGVASGGGSVKFASAASSGFVHPGILLGSSQLDFVRNKLATGQQPWIGFYSQMRSASVAQGDQINLPFTSLNYTPHPVSTQTCPVSSTATTSCADEKNDAIAAYADALTWYYNYNTGGNREAYAQKSIEIMNAWAHTLKTYSFAGPGDPATGNAPLFASWSGETFSKAAEILRYSYTPTAGKTALDVTALSGMLTSLYLPLVDLIKQGGGANGIMSMAEATASIGIFTDNRGAYNDGIAYWRNEVPSVIYQTTDTNPGYPNLPLQGYPIPPPGVSWVNSSVNTNNMHVYWHYPTTYLSGQEQETCRDSAHMAMGLGSTVNLAETARLQGLDLYGEERDRIASSLELNSGFLNSVLGGSQAANWPCQSAMPDPRVTLTWKVTLEVAYNEFANRLHLSLPNTNALLTQYSRPSAYKADFGFSFEGLTSYGTP
jgi:hypothetical protein